MRECNGKRQYREQRPTRGHQQHVSGKGGKGEGGMRGESLRGRHSHSCKENESRMTDKDSTEHPRHRKVGMEKLGESGENFNTQIWEAMGSWRAGEEEGAGGWATVKSQAKTPKIERHFHMYILQMYIDTIR